MLFTITLEIGQKALKQFHSAIDLAVTKSKKPVESLQAIVDACKKHQIQMNLQPTDPLILDDETQLKTSVLQKGKNFENLQNYKN